MQTLHWPFQAGGRDQLPNCHVYGLGQAWFPHGVRCDKL
jgi:hypothetical protein